MKLFHVARVTPTAGNGVLTLHAGDILADSLESAEIQARLMYPCNYDTGERLTCSESTQGITY